MYVKNTLLWDALQINVARLAVVLSAGSRPSDGTTTRSTGISILNITVHFFPLL